MDDNSPERPVPKYKRIVLKLSGEALRGDSSNDPINTEIIKGISAELKEIHDLGVEIGLVVGGGNIFRGLPGQSHGVSRTTGDFMGMLSTVINGLAFMECLEAIGVPVRVQSAVPMDEVAEPFILRRATRHLERKRLVIFVCGTGNPYFSTDSAAALRASEIGAEIFMKATKVDGIYDEDPAKNPKAKKYDEISFIDALKKRLHIMDSTAFSLCLDNSMPILVFNMTKPGSIKRAVMGEKIGTLVR